MKLSLLCLLLCVTGYVQALGRTILEGDVFIEFIGAIFVEPGKDINSPCSEVEAETVQNIQALKWTLSKLNDLNYINYLKIGLRVSPTCLKEGEAERLAHELASELYESKEARIVGVIGSDYSFETEAISRLLGSLPDQDRLLQMSFSATSASLRDRKIYKNFYRTIPPDDIQVEVMLKYLEILDWTYMAIIHDNNTYGRGGKDALMERSRGLDVCFPVQIAVDEQNIDIPKLEIDIKQKIIGADVPLNGILVFGNSVLADHVLVATENVIASLPNSSRPVFLFSEAGGYIQGHHTNVSRGAFVLSPPRRSIEEFRNEWVRILKDTTLLYQEIQSNTWIRDVYKSKFNCDLADIQQNHNCSQLTDDDIKSVTPDSVYNQYAIQTAMVMAKAVKTVYETKCPSQVGLCDAFLDKVRTPREDFINSLSQLKKINFDNFGNFRVKEFQNPDIIISFGPSCEVLIPDGFPIYEVYNHQRCDPDPFCLKNVAKYITAQSQNDLEAATSQIKDYDEDGVEKLWPNIRKAQCPDGSLCQRCAEEKHDDDLLFIPGDMYIVGIVPVHNKGSTPLKCGDMKRGGLDIVETIRFAVKEAKAKPAAEIGIIVIDSCNDPQIIQEKILTLHRLGVYKDGQYIYVGDKILGYIGGWSSDVSKAVAEITSRLGYPQISYASTAQSLSRRSTYPHFLRLPSPDARQAETILRLVQTLGANLIQILYSESEYGEGGRDLLLDLIGTSTFDHCVAQSLPVSRHSDKNEILSQIRKFPQAKVVVLFLGSFEIEYMIQTLNTISKNEFVFISSEGMGTRVEVSEYRNLIGTLTITSQLTINEKLIDHMKQLQPDGSNTDSWVRPYMEMVFDCYFQWSFNKTSNKLCSGNESLDVYKTDFRIDSWAPFAERAVTALLGSAEKALRVKCNGNTAAICFQYRNSTSYVYEQIKNYERLGSTGFRSRVFDDNGDGTAGYQIYVLDMDSSTRKVKYTKIGDTTLGTGGSNFVTVSFKSSLYNTVRGVVVNSTCNSNIDVCNKCFAPPCPNNLPVGVIIVIVLLGIISCVLGGILLFICNRHGCCLRIENGRPRFTATYLTPVYAKQRSAHGVDGTEAPTADENYDSIPNTSVGYNRSQGSSFSGRPPISDGGSSSATSSGGMGVHESSSRVTIGRENATFENDSGVGTGRQPSFSGSNQTSSSGGLSGARDNSYLSESIPAAHKFIKPVPAPAPPIPGAGVLYQADGSYITTNLNSKDNESGNSQPDRSSRSSDQSLGYLRSVQTNENNRI